MVKYIFIIVEIKTYNLYAVAHVAMNVVYCDCMPLVKILFEMQFLPSGSKSPNAAIHFGLLQYLHTLKMSQQVSNHGFAEVANITNDQVIVI